MDGTSVLLYVAPTMQDSGLTLYLFCVRMDLEF